MVCRASTAILTVVLLALCLTMPALPATGQAGAAPDAPSRLSPPAGTVLGAFTYTLSWETVAKPVRTQVQVVPYDNDGPGVDVTFGAGNTYTLPSPPDWYGLLPDMSYTWRVRVSSGDAEEQWSAWAESTFRTPAISPWALHQVSPADGGTGVSTLPALLWRNDRTDVFYYEVQLSSDPWFVTDRALATAAVQTALVHGGISMPANSYTVPPRYALATTTTYYWRVRSRVQGDGVPLPWSPIWSFTTAPVLAPTPAPTFTPVPTFTPTVTPTKTVTPLPTRVPEATQTPTPEPSPTRVPTYELVYQSYRQDNYEIYRVGADGQNAKNLTSSSGHDFHPAWSPDGRYIAYSSQRGGAYQVVIHDALTGDIRVPNVGTFAEAFAWSPDSRLLAIRYPARVVILRSDGTSFRDVGEPNEFATVTGMAWAPDQRQLLFTAKSAGGTYVELYRFEVAASRHAKFIPKSYDHGTPGYFSGVVRMLFGRKTTEWKIFSANTNGTGETQLTNSVGDDRDPVVSVNDKIAFVSNRDSNREVYVMDRDGANQTNLTQNAAADYNPVWSPDGRKIAFVSERDGNPEVYVMDADGANPVNVSNNPGVDAEPAWSMRR